MFKKKKAYHELTWDQLHFVSEDDAAGGPVGLTGDIIDVVGADGMALNGTNNLTGDIIMVAESQDVLVRTYAGDDIIFAFNSSGAIYAGGGGDIVDATTFTGVVDLGRDESYDTVLLTHGSDVQLRNFDTERDTVIWYGDAIA